MTATTTATAARRGRRDDDGGGDDGGGDDDEEWQICNNESSTSVIAASSSAPPPPSPPGDAETELRRHRRARRHLCLFSLRDKYLGADWSADKMTSRARYGTSRSRTVTQQTNPTPSIEESAEHHPRMESNISQPRANRLNGSSAASCTNRKRTRGKTMGIKWAKIRKSSETTKPPLKIPSDLRRVVGDNAQQCRLLELYII